MYKGKPYAWQISIGRDTPFSNMRIVILNETPLLLSADILHKTSYVINRVEYTLNFRNSLLFIKVS